MLYYVLYELVLFRKGDVCRINVSRMIFEGGILSGSQNFWGNPYLRLIAGSSNSTVNMCEVHPV